MTIPTITALPEIPAYSDANFETKAPAVLSALRNTFIAEMNAAIAAINNYDYGAAVNISKVVGLAAGRIPYGAGNAPLASSTNLFWDSVNSRLGIQQSAPVLLFELNVYGGFDGNANDFLIRNNIYYDAVDGRTEYRSTGYGTQIAMSNQFGIIKFSTAPSGASGDSATVTERVRIANDGNVGIGTTTPSTVLHVNGPARVGSYTVATVPSASTVGAGSMIYVTDDVGGAVIVFSDGTNWLRVTDRATVSTT